jgi:hypothetical protein
LARTKLAALRATRLLPCVVTLGLASNTPRRRPLNTENLAKSSPASENSRPNGPAFDVEQRRRL